MTEELSAGRELDAAVGRAIGLDVVELEAGFGIKYYQYKDSFECLSRLPGYSTDHYACAALKEWLLTKEYGLRIERWGQHVPFPVIVDAHKDRTFHKHPELRSSGATEPEAIARIVLKVAAL